MSNEQLLPLGSPEAKKFKIPRPTESVLRLQRLRRKIQPLAPFASLLTLSN